MIDKSSNINAEGDVFGVAGKNEGTINITYISQTSSDDEIHARKLITGSPYLGLNKFETDDSSKFFGRDSWKSELTEYLKAKNILLLLGASGSGKSSLIRAGLIPTLKEQSGYERLVHLAFAPDINPFEALYACLYNQYKQSDVKLARIKKEDTLIKVVQSLQKDSQWLIFIDQFEELFTRTPKTCRDIFIKSLIQLIEKPDTSVKIVLTMRADFLDKLSPYPKLGKIHDSYSRMLTDMDDSDLKLAIQEPSAINGVTFQPKLIEQIITDFRQQAGSLPLLQYTLDELWKKHNIINETRVLNTKTYQDLGGVKGALQKQADDIFYNKNNKSEYLNEEERQAARKIFLALISLEGKEPVSKRADKCVFEKDDIQKNALNKLIDNRLLVSKEEGGKGTVEVAHETLLRSWTVLQDLIGENEEIIILRNRLSADAKQWDELRQKDSREANAELWSGAKLARIVELEKEQSLPNLGDVVREFIQASVDLRDQEQKEQERRRWNDEINQINTLAQASDGFLSSDTRKAVKSSVMAAEKMLGLSTSVDANTRTQVELALLNTIHNVVAPNTLGGHANSVNGVSFSPDGKMASASDDHTVKLWDTSTGKVIKTLTGHENSVKGVSFSPNGKMLASASDDNTVKLWNTSTGKVIKTLTVHTSSVNRISFSPNGKMLASASYDQTVKLWDTSTGKVIKTLSGHINSVWGVSFSPDSKMLASASEDHTVKLWNTSTGKVIKTLDGHKDAVWGVSFSPDGKMLSSASADNTVKLWDTSTGKVIKTLNKHTSAVAWVSFSPDGKMLASASEDHTVKLWNTSTGKVIKTLDGHKDAVLGVSFSPDGKILASASDDNTVKLWDTSTGEVIKTLTGHTEAVGWVSFSPDNKMLASASKDKTVKLWDTSTGEDIKILNKHTEGIWGVSFSPDGKMLASASEDHTVKLWDTSTGEVIETLNGHTKEVKWVSFSPDGKILASASDDNTVKLWDTSTGEVIKTLDGHKDAVWGVSFSPDGKMLSSASKDKTVKLWDTSTGEVIKTLTGHTAAVRGVSFSPDGKILASASEDNTVKLWDTSTRKVIETLTGHRKEVNRVSFSPNGKILASASSDNTVKLWDTSTSKEIKTLTGHTQKVLGVSFSPNGKMLASASADNTVKLWRWDFDYLLKEGCNFMGESFKLCDGILGTSNE
jgi:WD40 repeat protein/energy-coupling factor transporter ATP-binding protein EcfA2